jgi:hypothetical protein
VHAVVKVFKGCRLEATEIINLLKEGYLEWFPSVSVRIRLLLEFLFNVRVVKAEFSKGIIRERA